MFSSGSILFCFVMFLHITVLHIHQANHMSEKHVITFLFIALAQWVGKSAKCVRSSHLIRAKTLLKPIMWQELTISLPFTWPDIHTHKLVCFWGESRLWVLSSLSLLICVLRLLLVIELVGLECLCLSFSQPSSTLNWMEEGREMLPHFVHISFTFCLCICSHSVLSIIFTSHPVHH